MEIIKGAICKIVDYDKMVVKILYLERWEGDGLTLQVLEPGESRYERGDILHKVNRSKLRSRFGNLDALSESNLHALKESEETK